MIYILLLTLYKIAASSLIELSVNSGERSVIQTSLIQLFEFNIRDHYNFYMIEIRIQNMNDQNVMLAYKQGSEIGFNLAGKIVYDKIDYNGYALSKSYQYIVLNNDELNAATVQYIGVLTSQQLSYKISVKGYDEQPCPQSCNNNGICVQGQCVCDQNYIDEDCSVFANQINIGTKMEISNYYPNVAYVYYQSSGQAQTLKLTLSTQSQEGIYVRLLVPKLVHIPSPKYYTKEFILYEQISPFSITIIQQQEEYTDENTPDTQHNRLLQSTSVKPSMLVLAFDLQQYGVDTFVVELEETHESKNPTMMIIIIVVSIIGTLLFISLCYLVYRIKKKRSLSSSDRVYEFQTIKKNQDIEEKQSEEFFPVMVKCDLEKISDDQCSVCLENFNEKNEVRQTPCNHFFHLACIKLWLQKHAHCPLCRTNLKIQDLAKAKSKKIQIRSRQN